MFDLTGKTALITGAAGGIGQAIAKTFDALGAEVVITGRNPSSLQALAQQLSDRTKIIVCDLAQAGQAANLAKQAEEACGKIDILVNNAGLTKDTLFMRMKEEDLDEVMNVDFKAAFMLTKEAVKGMVKRRWGRIISVASIVGFTGNVGQANYAAAKAALVAASKSLAMETASRNITVNCLAPGFIDTDMTKAMPDAVKESVLSKIPQGKAGTPQDIAYAAAFLADDKANYITGQTLHINGGMAMF